MGPPKILVVEDEAIIALELNMLLQSHGFSVIPTAISGEQALKYAKKENPHVILMDVRIKGKLNGINAAKEIRNYRKIPIIFLTGNADLISASELKKTNPIAVLSKPVAEWELLEAIELALNSIEL